jgi:diadenosine tetraphosphate (Ap4A) HIT family hydrolase
VTLVANKKRPLWEVLMNQDFKDKFRIHELTLEEYDHWLVSLRPAQPTLGSLVVSLKRDCQNMGDLTAEETQELSALFRDIEKTLKSQFNYDKINYLFLMMVDHHVHCHVIPRYETPRELEGFELQDHGWPKPPNLGEAVKDEKLLSALVDRLRNQLK